MVLEVILFGACFRFLRRLKQLGFDKCQRGTETLELMLKRKNVANYVMEIRIAY